jgi:hypothetical protein
MNRRSLCSAGFFASLIVVLTALSACTDPNTQVNDPRYAERSHADDARSR